MAVVAVARPTAVGTLPAVRTDWWGAAWFVFGTAVGARPLSDNSFLTHLATGRLIIDGRIPHADPYTFSVGGRPWVVQSWLFSAIDAALERVLGGWALRVVVGLLVGTLVATVWRLSRPATSMLGRVAVTAGAVAIGLDAWNERPQTVAFLLLALTLVVLVEGHSRWWLAPIFGLWVNLHGSWPVGLAVVALVALATLIEGRDRSVGDLAEKLVAPVVIAGGACVVGALVSPYGVDLLSFPVRLVGRSDVLRYLKEWRRPSIGDFATWALALQVGIALWALRRRRGWAWLPLVVVMAVLAASGRRNVPLASLVLIPVAAPALAGIGVTSLGRALPRRVVAAVAVATTLVVGAVVAAMPSAYDLGPYPVNATDWMDARELVARSDVRVAHPDYVGNYLEWRYGPRAATYLDDRAELLDEPLIAGYAQTLMGGHGDWRRVLRRDGIDVVVWPVASRLGKALGRSDDWAAVHRSTDGSGVTWIVACRVDSAVISRCRGSEPPPRSAG